MAATKRQMNITGCGFTPSGGSATTYTGVTSVATAVGGSLVKFSGDGDRQPTTTVNDFNDGSVTIQCADMAACYANVVGTHGTLVYTYKDAKLATGGNLTVTVLTAVVADIDFNGQHRQIGGATVTFATESSDGVTSPFAFSLT